MLWLSRQPEWQRSREFETTTRTTTPGISGTRTADNSFGDEDDLEGGVGGAGAGAGAAAGVAAAGSDVFGFGRRTSAGSFAALPSETGSALAVSGLARSRGTASAPNGTSRTPST